MACSTERSMDDLASLRTAKAALDEGLITAQDFDVVKVAFLKAQQIKAGLDAGFIRDEDYDKATHAYMHALDFQIMTAMPSLSSGPGTRSDSTGMHGAPTARAAPAAAAPAVPARQPVPPIERGPVAGGVPVRLSSTSTPRAAPTAPAAELGSSSVPSGAASMDEGGGGGGAALLDIPTDLPDYCKGATNGKTSMSGIAIDATCVNLFMHMKTRKQVCCVGALLWLCRVCHVWVVVWVVPAECFCGVLWACKAGCPCCRTVVGSMTSYVPLQPPCGARGVC